MRTRLPGFMGAAIALAALLCLASSCANSPATRPSAASPADASPRAATVAASPESTGTPSSTPEPSFARRRALASAFIVASLHEPPLRAGLDLKAALSTTRRSPKSVAGPRLSLPEPVAPERGKPKAEAVPTPAARATPVADSKPPAAAGQGAAKAQASPTAKPAATASKPAASATKPADAKAAPKAEETTAAKEPPSLPLAPPSSALAAAASPASPAMASRNVSIEAGARVELPFDGTGWTYLGEKEGREGVAYETRRFEDSGVVFVLSSAKPGDYLLRFQRQDALRGLSYDELVALKVVPKPAARVEATSAVAGAATAPAAGPGAPAAPSASASAGASAEAEGQSAGDPVTASSAAAAASAGKPAPDSPEGMILEAKNQLGAGKVQGAIEVLDRLLARYPAGIDEAYYLYALALEQNGPLKDVKRAYALYKKVCSDYPLSAFWDASSARVSYIERHYFEIR